MTVMWHKLPYTKYILNDIKKPMVAPFFIGGLMTFVIAGVLPTLGATDEDKMKSNYWKRANGKMDHGAHH